MPHDIQPTRVPSVSAARRTWHAPAIARLGAIAAENSPSPTQTDSVFAMGS